MKRIFIITAITAASWGLVACDKTTTTTTTPTGRTETTVVTPSTTVTNPVVGTDTTRTVGAAFDDAKIVTAVNAELVKDSELSALKINVDSKNGNVLLKGNAPNQAAKDRAESLAKGTKDVVSVDNQLMIGNPGNVTNNPTLNDAKDSVAQGADKAVAATSNAYDATKEKASELSADAKKNMNDPNSSLNKTVDKVEGKLDDAAINVSVNAKLAADNELSAIKVNVDVKDGRVLLKGTAPNSAAKSRATDLAKQANGVVSVDNQLTVAPK